MDDDTGSLLLLLPADSDQPILGSFTWRELHQLFESSSSHANSTLKGVVQQPVTHLEQSDVVVIKVLCVRTSSGSGKVDDDGDDGRGGMERDTLHPNNNDTQGDDSQRQFLIKYVNVPAQQQHITKTEEKWAISVRSFQNEANFYHHCSTTVGNNRLAAAGVHLPGCQFKVVTHDDMGKLQTSTLLLDYYAPPQYVQHHQLTFEHATVALGSLARFHACYWRRDSQAAPGIFNDLFDHGGWWRPKLRPSVKYDTIAEAFASLCSNFSGEGEFAGVDTPENHALIRSFQARVPEQLSAKVRAKGPRTLIHGDCKTSNLFFSSEIVRGDGEGNGGRTSRSSCKSGGKEEEKAAVEQGLRCSLIDFQWTGAASSGMGDVAYLLWSGVDVDGVRREAELLDGYYQALRAALPASTDDAHVYTRQEMESDYALEFLAYFATALPQLLNSLDEAYCEKWRGTYGWLTCETIPEVTAAFVKKALSMLREMQW